MPGPSIANIVAQIRTALYGRDVRENIALGIEKCYSDVTDGVTVADEAAAKIDNMTVSASAAAGSVPDVTITEDPTDGHKIVSFRLVRGETGEKGDKGDAGKDFHIKKTFSSITAMQAYDPSQDQSAYKVLENDFVMIDTGSVEDADTGKLYCYEPQTQQVWRLIGDLSGSQGIQGPAGKGIDTITLNNDYTLTIAFTDGTSVTTESIRGATGPQGPQGATGETGSNGVNAYVHFKYSANQPASDSDMKDTADAWIGIYSGSSSTAPTTYTSYTWYKIKGEQGSVANIYGDTIPMSANDNTKVATAIGNRIEKPATDGTNGQVLTSDGQGGQSWQTPSGGTVTDVQADGVSLLSNGVANILSMTGASSSANGTKGFVPAPSAGDHHKVLTGDGTWKVSPGAKVYPKTITLTNVSGSYSQTFVDDEITADMKAVELEYSKPYIYGGGLNIIPANGSFTVTCEDLAGTDTVTISFIKVIQDPTAITSTEFDILNNRLLAVEDVTTQQDITIAVSDWALTNGAYQYEWTSPLIQAGSDVRVIPKDGVEESGVEGIDANPNKAAGKVVFTSADLPSGSIPLAIQIVNAKPNGLQVLMAENIGSEAITGCDNVEEALEALNSNMTPVNISSEFTPLLNGVSITAYKCGKILNVSIGIPSGTVDQANIISFPTKYKSITGDVTLAPFYLHGVDMQKGCCGQVGNGVIQFRTSSTIAGTYGLQLSGTWIIS